MSFSRLLTYIVHSTPVERWVGCVALKASGVDDRSLQLKENLPAKGLEFHLNEAALCLPVSILGKTERFR